MDFQDQTQRLPFYMTYPLENMYRMEMEYEKDLERMKALYPREVKALLPYVEDFCDRLEYEGSRIYDEEPDRQMMEQDARALYQEIEESRRSVGREPEEAIFQEAVSQEGISQETNVQEGIFQEASVQENISRETNAKEEISQEMNSQDAIFQETIPQAAMHHERRNFNFDIPKELLQETVLEATSLPASGRPPMRPPQPPYPGRPPMPPAPGRPPQPCSGCPSQSPESGRPPQKPGRPPMRPPQPPYPGRPPMPPMSGNSQKPCDNWMCSLVGILFRDEIYRRRCRHRRCERWW